MATIKFNRPRGEENHFAVYTETAVARAKRLILDAERVEVLANGEIMRISRETGISVYSLRRIAGGEQWTHVDPAPAEQAAT